MKDKNMWNVIIAGITGGVTATIIVFLIQEFVYENPKIYGNVAEWVGAAGTIGTVWFASYTKKQKGIINAKVSCRVRKIPQIIDDPSGRSGKVAHSQNVTEFQVILSNLGNANLLVTELEVEIEKDCKFNLIMSNPKVIKAGDVQTIYCNGFDNISNNKFFPKKVYDYVKTNKIKLSLTTHEGKKTDWPIEVMKPPF
ncbi:hypothetical protein [Weissella thailandensis]|uniref:Uncharacterized protein n=1 Tax=Weissella thailandensis TaxID=89061 RepID=A0ABX9I4K6_9LACO|nr:hypothetical protein [Weissella thailandensis]NKY90853.1 hypothetical protein [Weissella thailandensis]RDS59644.1 hypothetical protein DWV05_04785 [Weissella thailandensis]GEP75474.1 hypothetical protein WTH01_17210 [Weissella thailandensis]